MRRFLARWFGGDATRAGLTAMLVVSAVLALALGIATVIGDPPGADPRDGPIGSLDPDAAAGGVESSESRSLADLSGAGAESTQAVPADDDPSDGDPSGAEIAADLEGLRSEPDDPSGPATGEDPADLNGGQDGGQDGGPSEDPFGAEYLEARWGQDALPEMLGSLLVKTQVSGDGDQLEAHYAGTQGSAIDIAKVTITDAGSSEAASEELEGRLEGYPDARLSFDLGTRSIRQGATLEEHPEDFPPALQFAWVDGRYLIRCIAVPVRPGGAVFAREEILGAVAALPY